MRFITTVCAVALGGAIAVGFAAAVWHLVPIQVTPGAQYKIEYTDFVSLMLTAVSIILAALGFVVALLAVIGWNSIGSRVSTIAKELFHHSIEDGELRAIVKKSLERDGELYKLVQNEAKEIIYRSVEPINFDQVEDDRVEDKGA